MRQNVVKAFFLIVTVICIHSVMSEYVEETGTTDENGYGLDSAFQITDWGVTGSIYASYCFDSQSSTGFYNYTFDEIQMAPATSFPGLQPNLRTSYGGCFIIVKDNRYTKVQILDQIQGYKKRFRYGTSTLPNDRMLVKSTYDRSIRYNVNNLFNHKNYCGGSSGCTVVDSLYWETPLPNNNQQRGYILYVFESNEPIDTTKSAAMVKWDSVAFYPPTITKAVYQKFPLNCYFNMVSVYKEGKSDFLDNWTYVHEDRVGNRNAHPTVRSAVSGLSIKATTTELVIGFGGLTDHTATAQIDLYTLTGRLIASWPIDRTYTFWRIPIKLLPSETCVLHFTTATGKVSAKPVFCLR